VYSPPGSSAVERCRFIGCGRSSSRARGRFDLEGEVFEADIVNPEVLRGDLPYGAEIAVAFGGPGGSRAQLLLEDSDRLPPDLCGAIRNRYWTPQCGLLRERGAGWDYLMLVCGEDEDICLQGALELRGPTAIVLPPERRWRLRTRLLDRIHQVTPSFPLRLAAWEFSVDGVVQEQSFPELVREDLRPSRFASLAEDFDHRNYWSDSFDPDFYKAQARSGFIAIAYDRGDRRFLMPTLHDKYAVLDWENLHRGRSLARRLGSGALVEMGLRLVVTRDLDAVLDALADQWRGRSWLLPEYRTLMKVLASDPKSELRPWAIEIRVKGEPGPVAGELGYALGRSYTSLSGFHRPERREWSGLGTVQLHLLADLLRERGFDFWNLGDPRPEYKQGIGARLVPRGEFLPRWEKAVSGKTLDLGP